MGLIMSKSSVSILQNTQGLLNVTGEPVRADGWYGHSDGLHTVAIYLNNFQGRIYFEASISPQPIEEDWFPISVNGSKYLSFPEDPLSPTGVLGDSGTIGFNLIGNFTWLRARVDRSYIAPEPTDQSQIDALGYVDRVLLNN
jgi:hypothetical protein